MTRWKRQAEINEQYRYEEMQDAHESKDLPSTGGATGAAGEGLGVEAASQAKAVRHEAMEGSQGAGH